MRQPEIITREIQDLDRICLNTKELSQKFPNDNLLRLTIEQSEFRKENLIIELDKSLHFYGRHSLRKTFIKIYL